MSVSSNTEPVVSVRESRRLGERVGVAGAVLGALFIIYVGGGFLIAPDQSAPGFGFTDWPRGAAEGFLNVKGVRDVVSGLILLALLAAGNRRSLGVATLTTALIPTGDMLTVLARGGSTTIALSVHGLAAVLVAASGVLLLRRGNR